MCLHIIGLLIGCIFAINARIKTKRKVLDPGKAAVFDRFHSKPDVTADLTRRSSRNSFHLTTAGEETLKGWGGGAFSRVTGTQRWQTLRKATGLFVGHIPF